MKNSEKQKKINNFSLLIGCLTVLFAVVAFLNAFATGSLFFLTYHTTNVKGLIDIIVRMISGGIYCYIASLSFRNRDLLRIGRRDISNKPNIIGMTVVPTMLIYNVVSAPERVLVTTIVLPIIYFCLYYLNFKLIKDFDGEKV